MSESRKCLPVTCWLSLPGSRGIQPSSQRFVLQNCGEIFLVLSVFCLQNIRDFYLASDGFRLSWSYNYAGQLLPLGNMTLNRVADLRRVGGLRYNFDTEQPTLLDIESVDSCGAEPAERKAAEESLHPQFGLRWKIFEDSVLQFLILSKLNASYPPIIGINANMQ